MVRDSSGVASPARRDLGLGQAVEHVYEAGQALIVRRLELSMAEARLFARNGFGFAFAGVVAFAGWFYFIAGLIDALARDYPRFAVEMSVGGFHVVLALALFGVFQRATEKLGDRS